MHECRSRPARRPDGPTLRWLVVLLLATSAASAGAQTGANVLVVVNQSSAVSVRIGEYYAGKRAVPPDQIVRLALGEAEEVSRPVYEQQIEAPLARWFARHQAHDRILYIVLAKGVPLRIQGSAGRQGTVASVDSELALLYRRMAGSIVTTLGPVGNPYFLGDRPPSEARPFSHRAHDIYLVTRLDGFTEQDVMRLIDRALEPAGKGRFILDGRAALDDPGNDWLREAARRLESAGLADLTRFDATSRVLRGEPAVLGYFSWGSTDPAVRGRTAAVDFVPGAIGAMFVSTDARTFAEPPAGWTPGDWEQRTAFYAGSPQSLIGDLIREGITGVAGQVAEPYLDSSVRPQVLFPAYAAGFNLAEAFYLALPSLSWQTVVVGDPLCAPIPRQTPSADPLDPGVDAATETAVLFARRRLAALATPTTKTEALQALLRAESRLARSEPAAARAALEEATRLQPTLIAAHLQLASLLEGDAAFDAAAASYRHVLETAPNHIAALNNLAYLLAVHKGQPGDALPLAERAYTLSQAAPAVRADVADTVGWIHHLLGNSKVALRLLAEATALAPEKAELHLHYAVVRAVGGDLRGAAVSLARAVELDGRMAERPEARQVERLIK